MTELTELQNIGKEMARKLMDIGIDTPEKLRTSGSTQVFSLLKMRYPNVCLVHLYALEGAIQNMEYNRLPEDTKEDLKEFNGLLKWK